MPLFHERFHQLAVYVNNPEIAVGNMKHLGYDEWLHDEATLKGEVNGEPFATRGSMWFNYEFYGDPGYQGDAAPAWVRRPSEMEFLRYRGYSWHAAAGRTDDEGGTAEPFISHMSTYVKSAESESLRLKKEYGLEVVQWFETSDHVNKYLKAKKQRFYEFIFDAREWLGFDLKVIQKIYD